MSEPIRVLEQVRGRTFVVDGKNVAMNVESYGRYVVLTPYYSESFPEDAKTLEVNSLTDFAGFKIESQKLPIEMVEDKEAPVLVDLIQRSNNTVEAVFDKDVFIGSVDAYYSRTSVGNISYESGRHIVYAEDAYKKIQTRLYMYLKTIS